MNLLGDRAVLDPPEEDLWDETRRFLGFLLTRATREPGDDTKPLVFVGTYFKVGIILFSRAWTAALGPYPYVRRAAIDLAQGCESIYLLAVNPDQAPLLGEVAEELDGDRRVTLEKDLESRGIRTWGGDSFRSVGPL